ncbi:MAG: cellulase family glycosylhydrolase, partial [Coleofasciculaceae cyanobacterium]
TVDISEATFQQPTLSPELDTQYRDLGLNGEVKPPNGAFTPPEAYSLPTLSETGTISDDANTLQLTFETTIPQGGEFSAASLNNSSSKTKDPLTGSTQTDNLVGDLGKESFAKGILENTATSSKKIIPKALLVADSVKLGALDQAVKGRLENLGYQVTVRDDDVSKSSDAKGQDLVLISESVIANKVKSEFTDVAVPVITWEASLYDDLKLTGSSTKNYGVQRNATGISVTNKNHPLAANLSTSTQVYDGSGNIAWGVPNDNAIEIASLKGSSQKSTVFAYEKGADLFGGKDAAERRVGLFLNNAWRKGDNLTSSAWQLFDAAVSWADGGSSNNTEGGSSPIENDTSPVENDASPVENDTSPVENDTSPVENDASPVENDASPIENDTSPIENDASPVEDDASPIGEDIAPIDNNLPKPKKPSGKATGEFQVKGSKIYDPNGVEFIAKGVNVPGYRYTWPGDTLGDADAIVEDWGFNMVRLNNYFFTKARWPQSNKNNNINAIIDEYTERGVVVMVEAHDHLGGFWPKGDLEKLKSKFEDLAERYKDNPYVWFSINEPGGNGDNSMDKWVKQHQEIIEHLRDDVGVSNPIVVNAIHWGQDGINWGPGPVKESESSIIKYGDQLKKFNGKTYENIIFDVHLYNNWRYGEAKMANYFDRVLAKDHAIIVGEYGGGDKWTEATRDMFDVVAPREIGRVAWAWWGGDDNDLTNSKNGGGQHINSTNNPTNLSEMGKLVWKDNRRKEDLEKL